MGIRFKKKNIFVISLVVFCLCLAGMTGIVGSAVL